MVVVGVLADDDDFDGVEGGVAGPAGGGVSLWGVLEGGGTGGKYQL